MQLRTSSLLCTLFYITRINYIRERFIWSPSRVDLSKCCLKFLTIYL